MKKNYYEILGITDDEKKLSSEEFTKILKNKYRNLCKQWHPDKCHDEKEKSKYEENFKNIAEAYAVLSDEKKRKEYDNPVSDFNFSGFNNFGGFDDFINNFNFDIFGGFNGASQPKVVKGSSIKVRIGVTLEEVLNGGEKTIKYKRHTQCPDCKGKGSEDNSGVETCSHCGGTGKEFIVNGNWQEIRQCSHCNGKGKIVKNPCKTCHGNGIVETENVVNIHIPKGVESDMHYIINDGGNMPLNCEGACGDLIVYFYVLNHETFHRNNNDVVCTLEIPLLDALLGSEKEITTLNNQKLLIKIKPCTENNAQLRIRGKGLPMFNNNNVYGDMIGIVKIKMPKELNEDEIKKLTELKNSTNFK